MTVSKCLMVLAATTLVAPLAAQSPLIEGLKATKGDSVVVGINLEALKKSDNEVITSGLEDARTNMRADGIDAPANNALEAAGKVALLDEASNARAIVASMSGINAMTGEEPAMSVAVVGDYTAEGIGEKLATYGFSAGETEGTFTSPTASGTGVITAVVPTEGILLFSTNGDQNAQLLETAKSTTAADSRFSAVAAAMGGRVPDMFFFTEGKYVREAAQGNQMIGQFVGPLLKADGMLIALADGNSNNPLFELHSSYATENDAKLAGSTITELVNMGRMMIGQMADPNQMSAEEKAQFELVNGLLNDIQVVSRGNNSSMRLPLGRIVQNEELLQQIQQGMQGGMMPGF